MHGDTHTQVEERRAEISKQAALVAVETSLSAQVGELRQSAEAAWRGEQDAALLRAQAVSVLEEALDRARVTQDTEELREVVLQAVRTTSRDALCVKAVQAAVREGVDVNIRMEEQESWLRAAAKQGLVATMKALVEAGADVNATNDAGWTALTGATRMGQVEALQALFEAGVAVNHQVP